MEYLNAQLLIKNVNNNENYSKMIDTMKEEVLDFYNNFDDDYNLLSGWGHNYFCDYDGGRLIYDKNKQTSHICEVCGKEYSGGKYDTAWRYIYRNNAFINSWKSAILFKVTGEEIFLNYFYDIIGYYSDNYKSFKLHNKAGESFDNEEDATWGCGRIQPQSLNESIIVIKLLNALQIVKEDLNKDFIDGLYKNFFSEMYRLLKPQVNKIHNISCWLNSVIGSIGFFYDDKEMLDFVFNGEFNINKQLEKGVTKDGFWFEGSIHYNYFTLEGISNLALFSKVYDYKFDTIDIVEKMLVAGYELAFDNHTLPNPNDGWPNLNLKTYSYIYCMGVKIFGEDSYITTILKNIVNKDVERGQLPLSKPYYYNNEISIERLTFLYNVDFDNYETVKVGTKNFEGSQFAVLKNDTFNVFCKYGHNGPSHAHPDKMNIEVVCKDKIVTRDLSNAGYGSKMCNEWHRVSASHNTVVVNGENQVSMERGKVLNFTDDSIDVLVEDVYTLNSNIDVENLVKTMNIDEVYKYLQEKLNLTIEQTDDVIKNKKDISQFLNNDEEKVNYNRKIKLMDNEMIDSFNVKCKEGDTVDYFLHLQGELETNSLNLKPTTLGYSENGYQHIKLVRQLITHKPTVILPIEVDGVAVNIEIDLKGKKLFIAETYDNPVSNHRNTVILRSNNQNTNYDLKWKLI